MSGLNPFRPRKSEGETSLTAPSEAMQSGDYEQHSWLGQTRQTLTTADTAGRSSPPSITSDLTSPAAPASNAPQFHDLDADADLDSVSSDDQSVTNPFTAEAFHDAQEEIDHSERDESPVDGLGITTAAPDLPRSTPATNTTASKENAKENIKNLEKDTAVQDATETQSSTVIQAIPSLGGSQTASSSSTDVSQPSSQNLPLSRPALARSESGDETKVLASRAGNKEKRPPPPPKSHHGKYIGSSLATSQAPQQALSRNPTNRFSFHGFSDTSLSQQTGTPQRSSSDQFAGLAEDDDTVPAESLRRTQSQTKRAPTPPLSRRQSQMRRSKSTHSKASAARLAMAGDMEALRLDRRSTASSLQGSESSTPQSDELPSRRASSLGDPDAAISISTSAETRNPPVSRTTSIKAAKRASYAGSLAPAAPPPPPPRRIRRSSNNSTLSQEQKAEPEEHFVAHPSNANDILADLSRLQKEVDDLRGHYENRKGSS